MEAPLPWFTALFFLVCTALTVAAVLLLFFAARAVLGGGGSKRVLELVAAEVALLLVTSFAFTFFAVAPVREVTVAEEGGRSVTVYEYGENPYFEVLSIPLAAAIVAAFFVFPLAVTWFFRPSRRVHLLVER